MLRGCYEKIASVGFKLDYTLFTLLNFTYVNPSQYHGTVQCIVVQNVRAENIIR